MTDTTGTVGSTDEWRLRDERQFLVQSLDDAAREHAAGDLSDADYDLLRRRDARRLGEVEASLAALATKVGTPEQRAPGAPGDDVAAEGDGSDGTKAGADPSIWPTLVGDDGDSGAGGVQVRRHRRVWLALVGVACVVAGLVVLVVNVTAPSQPGQTITGSHKTTAVPHNVVRQQLALANKLAAEGTVRQAITRYGKVLTEEPNNVKALASWGWLTFQVAVNAATLTPTVVAESESAVARSLQLDPTLFPAQYYLGDMLYQQGKYTAAVRHLAEFLALDPPKRWLQEAAHVIRSAYTRAGLTVPSSVPYTTGAPSTTPLTGAAGSSTGPTVPAGTPSTTVPAG